MTCRPAEAVCVHADRRYRGNYVRADEADRTSVIEGIIGVGKGVVEGAEEGKSFRVGRLIIYLYAGRSVLYFIMREITPPPPYIM